MICEGCCNRGYECETLELREECLSHNNMHFDPSVDDWDCEEDWGEE